MENKSYLRYCGIDIAARSASVAVLSPTQHQVDCFDIEQTKKDYAQLRIRLQKGRVLPDQILVVLEPTGTYWIPLARDLRRAGYNVSVVNSLTARNHFNAQMNRDKTDKIDALNLAEIGWLSTGRLELWKEPPPIYEEIRQRLALRDELKDVIVKQKNRRHAVEYRTTIAQMDLHRNEMIDVMEKKVKILEREIKRLLLKDADWGRTARVLLSIQGLGLYTVASILTLTMNFSMINSQEQLAAFIGVVPREESSGETQRRYIKFSSAPRLRQSLYVAITSAISHNPVIKAYHKQLIERGKPKKVARLACMNKLLKIAWGCYKNDMMFDPKYAKRQQLQMAS